MDLETNRFCFSSKVHPNIAWPSLVCTLMKNLQHRVSARKPAENALPQSVGSGVKSDPFVLLAEFLHERFTRFLRDTFNVDDGLLEGLLPFGSVCHVWTLPRSALILMIIRSCWLSFCPWEKGRTVLTSALVPIRYPRCHTCTASLFPYAALSLTILCW